MAQLYSVAEVSKNETGGGEGIEVLKNEPFDNFPLLGKNSLSQEIHATRMFNLFLFQVENILLVSTPTRFITWPQKYQQ